MATWTPPGGTQSLVVAGSFTTAGDISATNIAYWDGINWHALGSGLTGTIHALAVYNGELYAGGDITASGATILHNLVKWNGSAWQDALFGVDGTVNALVVNGTELLVGGSFTHEGGGLFAYNYFARFTASSWDRYAIDPPAPVAALAVFNSLPFVILNETIMVNGQTWQQTLRHWNGSQWALRNWFPASNNALFPYTEGVLYSVGSLDGGWIMSDDGTSGIQFRYYFASSFVSYGGTIYAIGTRYDFDFGNQIWMGSLSGGSWTAADSSLDPRLSAGGLLYNHAGALLLGGTFSQVFDGVQVMPATSLAQLAGVNWQPVSSSGFDGTGRCSATYNGSFVVGGDFTHYGNTAIGHAATWTGTTWANLANFDAPVTAISVYATSPPLAAATVVASGSFTHVGNVTATNIAQQNAQTFVWSPMGTGVNAPALAMMPVANGFRHNDLIVAGQFTTAGGLTANRIARWTGSAWATLGTGMNADVLTLANYNGIVAGGSFTTAGGAACNYIASWNGTVWSPLGAGLNGAVRALLVMNGRLIAGGDFTVAGTAAAAHLAAWDGSSWAAITTGVDGPVYALAASGSDLVVGGAFSHAGAAAMQNVAIWTGTQWWDVSNAQNDPLSTSVNGAAYTLGVASGTVLIGGGFTYASSEYSPFVARATIPGSATIVGQPANATPCPGGSASFQVGLNSGDGQWSIVTYSWYKDGVLLSDGTSASGSIYSNTHTATLRIDNVTAADAGGFSVTAGTDCGQTVSSSTAQLSLATTGCCGSADFNCDGDTGTDADIEAFFACLAGTCPTAPCTSTADFNGDGDVGTDADIESFFRVLAGDPC
jgi:hypothetical protein